MAESLAPAPLPDPIGARRRCDALCDEFEQAWLKGQRPSVQQFVARATSAERSLVIRELVALDCVYRRESGETPQPADYAALAPTEESLIAEAFSTHLRQNTSTGKANRQFISTLPPDQPRDQQAASSSKVGEQIGDYLILAEIARGGMGVVYKARHRTLDRIAAVKLIRGGDQAGSEELRRFQIEATAAAALDHPAIVPVYELGQHDGQPFLAMAFVEGTSLWTRVKEAPLEPLLAARIMQRVSEAVQYAHERGIIHRDLKPQNILLDATDQPRVTDFGLAKRAAANSDLTTAGQVLGTPSYMPPEQARGRDEQVGPLADVYSLGATLYCLLVGHPPFQSAGPVETLRQVIEREPISPRVLNRGIARDLETICLRCLQKNPAQRYPSAGALAADLQHFLRGEPIQARAISSIERAGRWCARNPVISSLSTAAVLLLIAVTVISTWAYFQQKALVSQKTLLISDKEKLIGEKDLLAKGERKQRLNAERDLYDSQIARSHAEIERGNLIAAQLALQSIPFPLRNWEHRYLTRRAQGTPFILEGHQGQQITAAFSPDGQWIASGGRDKVVRIWDAASGKQVKLLEGHPHMIARVVFSPDGERLASGSLDGTVILWDLKSEQVLQTIRVPHGPLWSLAYCPTGEKLATGTADGMIRLWDSETGAERLKFEAGKGEARGLSFHPNGMRIAVAIWMRGLGIGQLKVFDTSEGKQLLSMDGNRTYCQVIRYSPDGRLLATSSHPGLKLWDAETGAIVRVCASTTDTTQDLNFSPDGSQIVSGSFDKTIRLWDVRSGKELAIYRGHQVQLHAVHFNHDGTRVVSAASESGNFGELKVWNVTESPGDPLLRGHTDRANFLAFSPQGDLLASGSNDRTIKLWDVNTRRELRTLRGHGFSLMSLAFDHAGKQLVSVSFDAQRKAELKVWDVASGKEKFTIKGHNDWIFAAEFNLDDRFLATGSKDGTAKIWDVATRQEVATLDGHTGEVNSVSFHPNGKLLSTSSSSAAGDPRRAAQVIFWEVPTWKRLKAFSRPAEEGAGGAFSPNGNALLGASPSGVISLRDAANDRVLSVFKGHNSQLSGYALSGDATRLFSASYDHTLKVWDVSQSREILTIPLGLIPAEVTVHPSGQQVALGLTDNTIRLFDATLDREECWLRGHNSPIVAWNTMGGDRLATSDAAGESFVWELATGRRLEVPAPPDAHLTPVQPGAMLQAKSLNITIDICPSDPHIARLLRDTRPANRIDLWTLDELRRQASARDRHKVAADAAEKADDPYAAAFHWGWLKSHESTDTTAAEKHTAAVAKLVEKKLPVPK